MNIQDINNIDDSLLKARVGNKDPFVVPEGYFEGLTGRIMASLPAQPTVKSVPLRSHKGIMGRTGARWAAAAAVAALVVWGGYTYSTWNLPATDEMEEMAYSDDEIDEALDYVMMSNNDIATYLTMGE